MHRNTTTRDNHRNLLAQGQPPCAICGQPIDYTLRHPHPASYVVDHIHPLAAGGTDTIDNKQPAHRACNRAKSDHTNGGPTIRRSPTLKHPGGPTPPPTPPTPSTA